MALTIQVPNVLAADVEDVEMFYTCIKALPLAEQYVFDMSIIAFIKPYGAIALIAAARYLYTCSGQPVRLENLADQPYLYLDRMDIFDIGRDWLQPPNILSEEWARDPQTPNLLELTKISSPNDVTAVVSRSERIFSHWLKIPDLYNLLRVLSELCGNIYEHSGDSHGCVLIQKYQMIQQNRVIVCLAAGDLGCGIRGSLTTRYGSIGQEPLDYLHQAMSGQRTARSTGRGGLGLRTVEQLAGSEGGYLWLRSETAAIFSRNSDKRRGQRGLADIPGTQIAVEFHAPLQV